MIAFAMGFAKFSFTMLLFAVFGIGALIGGALLFVALPMARGVSRRRLVKQSWATPTWEQKRGRLTFRR